eukprot:CAMPEP_0117438786 /NCGR_PEP_ID=MMETSP0759-20121206/2234_1 /TAXON_ID=63605 /ORGANISM="Percolomonas cosmopolitus, Strain WS" /LENGTH=703 /DNA_ID=CAMNT_0005230491 /DNA_START=4 /DNA_END=2115 /DNA_ORIENTATION=+
MSPSTGASQPSLSNMRRTHSQHSSNSLSERQSSSVPGTKQKQSNGAHNNTHSSTTPVSHLPVDSANNSKSHNSGTPNPTHRLSLGTLTPRTALMQSNGPSYENYVDSQMRSLFEERLGSMMRLRVDMKDICEKQKREESSFVDTVKSMIKQMVEQKQNHNQILEEYHKRLEVSQMELEQEREEKLKAQEMFENFKSEGTNIIQRFRSSLGQITQQYKQERVQNQALNAKLQMLTKQLKHEKQQSEKFAELYQGALDSLQNRKYSTATTPRTPRRQSTPRGDEDSGTFDPDNDEDVRNDDPQFLRARNRALETKVFALKRSLSKARGNSALEGVESLHKQVAQLQLEKEQHALEMDNQLNEYKSLLDDQETIIRQLRAKIRSCEKENSRLSREARKKPVASFRSSIQSEAHPTEFLELYNSLKKMIDPEESKFLDSDPTKDEPVTEPQQKVEAQRKLIKLLLSKLKSEENQRLHTEEQTQEMITEQNTTIVFLEKKIKDFERNSQRETERVGSFRKSARQSRNSPPADVVVGGLPSQRGGSSCAPQQSSSHPAPRERRTTSHRAAKTDDTPSEDELEKQDRTNTAPQSEQTDDQSPTRSSVAQSHPSSNREAPSDIDSHSSATTNTTSGFAPPQTPEEPEEDFTDPPTTQSSGVNKEKPFVPRLPLGSLSSQLKETTSTEEEESAHTTEEDTVGEEILSTDEDL